MTNKKTLIKAITLATAGGWTDGNAALAEVKATPEWTVPTPACIAIIFNHDFAEALWPSSQMHNMADLRSDGKGINGCIHQVTDAQYHSQMMVVAENSIKYLEENI